MSALELVREELAGRSAAAGALPGQLVEAFNSALAAAEARITAAAAGLAAAWGWPPAEAVECTPGVRVPPGWHLPAVRGRLEHALRGLRLPPFPETTAGARCCPACLQTSHWGAPP
jgi:hypothetical protein